MGLVEWKYKIIVKDKNKKDMYKPWRPVSDEFFCGGDWAWLDIS